MGLFLSTTSFKSQSSVLRNAGQDGAHTAWILRDLGLYSYSAPNSVLLPHFETLNEDEVEQANRGQMTRALYAIL